MTPFYVITAVWGQAFADLLTTFSIPNQLSAGNLEAFPEGSRYRIFTDANTRLDVSALELVVWPGPAWQDERTNLSAFRRCRRDRRNQPVVALPLKRKHIVP
jgi:hypothetical protein